MSKIRYIDRLGRRNFVTEVHGKFITACCDNLALDTHRVLTSELPSRDTFEQAQADLDSYAVKKHWTIDKRSGVR